MKTYIALAAYILLLFTAPTRAENQVNLGQQALSNIRGSMGVNMVSGNNNQQGNLAAIAISGPAIIQFSQQTQAISALNGNQRVAIYDSALNQSKGLIGINQGAGEANQQVNAFALSLGDDTGVGAVTDINLSTSVATLPTGKVPANTTSSIYLDGNALAGSKGVIQVNQVTGQGNQAVNMVSLPLTGAVTASP